MILARVTLAIAALLAPLPALAEDHHALAYDQGNVVVGAARDAASAAQASGDAIEECRRDGGARCRIVWSDRGGGCVAIATTGSGSYALEAGGALDAVEDTTMDECRRSFADGASCQLELSFCAN